MIDATHFFVQTLINRLEGDCSSAQSRIRVALSMRAVKHAAEVQANPMIRALPQVRQELRRVSDCAEKRMDQLLEQQLKVIVACSSPAEIRTEHARLVRTEWCFLRGEFGSTFVRADRESKRLLRLAEVRHQSAVAEDNQDPDSDEYSASAPAP